MLISVNIASDQNGIRSRAMVWTFKRSNQTLQIETRFDNAMSEYLLIIRRLDGTEKVERFSDTPGFRTRLSSLERQLEAEHWHTYSVVTMQDGWRL